MTEIARPTDADFKALFEGAPALLLVLNRDLYIVGATDAYLRATLTERTQVVGRHLFDVFPDNPDDPTATGVSNLSASLEIVLRTRRADTMALQKYDIRKSDEDDAFEERFWSCSNTPVPDAQGEVAFIIHRAEDVTDYVREKQALARFEPTDAEIYERGQEIQAANRRLEAANIELAELRRQSAEKSAMLMATTRDAKFVLDAAGLILEANTEAERMLALSEENLLGKPITQFFPAATQADSVRISRPGLADAFVDITSAPVPIGESGQFLFIAREVTDRVKLEGQLRQSQKLEAIGQLTGGVAHDFNNLLTVIATTSEMLGEKLADQPQLSMLVAMIDKAADRGAQLTHRMLAFARRQPLQSRAVELNDIVSGMSEMLSRTLGDHVVLSTTLSDDVWPVLADPSQIEDALLNLAINARDAMPNGGQLIIETVNTHVGEEDAALSRDLAAGDYVSIVVSDTGQGMAPDIVARAVEPFFTTKEVGQGTGLGLSMVWGFVKQSHGHMVIYSEPGFGTSIRLFLPRALDQASARDAGTHADRIEHARGESILVVEDDVDVRVAAVALLEGLGYKVRAAHDGPEALRVLRAHHDIDLLFTDMMMPGGMSGLDLLREARRDRASLKALLTSGYPAQVIEKRGAAPVGAPLLGKPYRKRELARAIRAAIDG